MKEEKAIFFSLTKETFYAYEEIEGKIFIKNSYQIKSNNIQLNFKGREIIQSYKPIKKNEKIIPPLNNILINQNINISLSNKINKNEGYIIPFKFKLNNKNIPGSFFFFNNENLILAEIIYTITIGIDNLKYSNIIIIKEDEKHFNVFKELKTNKLFRNCCKSNKVEMNVSYKKDFINIGEKFKILVSINNTKNYNDGEQIYVELNKKVRLYPNNDPIEFNTPITSLLGKNKIKQNSNYTEEYEINFKSDQKIPSLKYLSSSEYSKYLKQNDLLLTQINQSIVSVNIVCEYSLIIWTCFPNFDFDDICIYFPLIVYPSSNLYLTNIKTLDTISEDDFDDIQINTNEEETHIPNFL